MFKPHCCITQCCCKDSLSCEDENRVVQYQLYRQSKYQVYRQSLHQLYGQRLYQVSVLIVRLADSRTEECRWCKSGVLQCVH